MKDTIIISEFSPEDAGGTPQVLRNILNFFGESPLVLITRVTASKQNNPANICTYRFPTLFLHCTHTFMGHLFAIMAVTPLVFYYILLSLPFFFIIKKHRAKKLFLISHSPGFIIAAYLATCFSGVSLICYSLDPFTIVAHEHIWILKFIRVYFGNKILKKANKIFVTNENSKHYHKKKLGLDTTILPIPFSTTLCYAREDKILGDEDGTKKIVFTGRVYGMQMDAVLSLIKAISGGGLKSVRFYLFSKDRRFIDILSRTGMLNSNIVHGALSHADSLAVQREADILFLPLSFSKEWKEVVENAFPSKAVEYFFSQKPVLIHAPAYAFMSKMAVSKRVAYVCSQRREDSMCRKIKEIIDNPDSPVAGNAFSYASSEHGPKKWKSLIAHI